MTDFSTFNFSNPKTRVVICSPVSAVSDLALHVLDFHQKEFDLLSGDTFKTESNSDFVILNTSNLSEAARLRPSIALISSEMTSSDLPLLLNSITPGGVLIFPEALENHIETAENYFRKLAFHDLKFKENESGFTLITEMGDLPVAFGNLDVLKNISGIQLLCQQFGIMEEDFYEAVVNFEPQ